MTDQQIKCVVRMSWLLAVGGLLAACSQEPPQDQAPVARPVKILTIGEDGAGTSLEFPGSITAAQQSDMAFEVPGRIVEMPVDEGEFVEAGAVLAVLDPRDYEAARDKALAQRNAARADFMRYEEAFKADAVTAQDVDLARRNLDVAEADLRTALKALEDTRLKAPFTGRVARKLVEDFANVQAKQPVLILQDDSGLEIKVDVAERDYAQAKPGLTLEERTARINPRVEIASLPDLQFPARIKEIASTADPVTRTYEATFAFDSPADVNIRPGMTGKVVVTVLPDVSLEAGLTIPANAVLADEENNPYVWIVANDTGEVSRRPVEVGALSGETIRVISGLNDGDRIAVSGVHSLSEGMPVRPLGE